ncbi:hypothetical protein DEO72_LG4g366 [Vigna unguiculata]|uniref:Uncharacterized protein n=1 Tax=Vigna unguiculata TaxID=3917 RepID=A0A4D6LKY6_VIGUN|nr:hypothetical protein DEO72_LG4g366 [Vigna unguiculata]
MLLTETATDADDELAVSSRETDHFFQLQRLDLASFRSVGATGDGANRYQKRRRPPLHPKRLSFFFSHEPRQVWNPHREPRCRTPQPRLKPPLLSPFEVRLAGGEAAGAGFSPLQEYLALEWGFWNGLNGDLFCSLIE